MMRRSTLYLFLAVLLTPALAGAQAKIGVGFLAPEIPVDPIARFSYVKALASHLEKAIGMPVQGVAFKGAAEFNTAVRKRTIQFAVLGAVAAAATKVKRVFAEGRIAGSGEWTLLGKAASPVMALKGATLQLPEVGRLVNGLVEHGLLGGNVSVESHFRIVTAPDLASSLTAMKLGKANLVFAPTGSAGLTPVIARTISIPPPSFVLVADGVPPAKVEAAGRAVLTFSNALGPLQGFRAGGGGFRRLAGLAAKRKLRMSMVTTSAQRLQTSLINASALQYEYASLDGLYKVP